MDTWIRQRGVMYKLIRIHPDGAVIIGKVIYTFLMLERLESLIHELMESRTFQGIEFVIGVEINDNPNSG